MKEFRFDPSEQVKVIPLEDLRESRSILDFTGRSPKNRPVEPVELIEQLVAMCNENRIIHNLDEIYVDKNNSRPTRQGQKEVSYDIGNWLFERILTRISFHDGNDAFNSAIGISYNEKGITLAFGTNVKICSNMSILHRDHCISTFGNDKETFDRMMIIFGSWLQNLPQHSEDNFKKLSIMQKKKLKPEKIDEFIGRLYKKAVTKAYINQSERNVPLNISQMSILTQNLLKENVDNVKTVYDFYNIGTQIFKPGRNDFATMFEDNYTWCEIIDSELMSLN